MKLTEKELAICRMTGAKWVARDDNPLGLVNIYFTEDRPIMRRNGDYGGIGKLGIMDARIFPSLERGACVKVEGEQPEAHSGEV